jgi:hypothetical protein
VLVGMLAAALALQLAVVYLPFAQEIFGTAALTAAQLGVAVGLGLAILVLMEIDKALRGRSTPCAPERRQLAADLVLDPSGAPRSSAPRRPPGGAVAASRVTTPPSELIECGA